MLELTMGQFERVLIGCDCSTFKKKLNPFFSSKNSSVFLFSLIKVIIVCLKKVDKQFFFISESQKPNNDYKRLGGTGKI